MVNISSLVSDGSLSVIGTLTGHKRTGEKFAKIGGWLWIRVVEEIS